MTSQIPALKLHTTPRTPDRKRPIKGASLIAASTEDDDLKTWMARFQELFGEVSTPMTVQSLPRKAVISSQKHANHSKSSPPTLPVQTSGTNVLPEYPVFGTAYVLHIAELLDEEVELCWPLSKETSGLPGPELNNFKILHHQVWKMFESAEDLMSDEYLEACSSQSSSQGSGS
jgi:hypothetical protein